MSVKSFVEKLNLNNSTNKLIVYLDSKIYPNEFGISVRPLQVRDGNTIIDMKQLIDIFGKVPYITVKENRYRSVYRDPMIMTIDLTPKEYKDNTYYDYYIDKLCLRNELKKYISIEKKAHDVIHEFKKSQDVETYRDSRSELDDVNDVNEEPI
ncbi:hypothetical protein M9Y10_003646 [Tritrichomonas musculus]|uniref:Uncharacterized protein n=1 Tax=Tritrichomonas musculus TaxID=1915356 RepID=A0ABR2JST7_9EUKA